MEGENQEVVETPEVQEQVVNQETFQSTGSSKKTNLPLIIGAIVGIVAVVIIAILLLSGGHKAAVKDYCKAFSKFNAKKVVKTIDPIGSEVWEDYDAEDFDKDDYDDFIEDYKDAKKDMDVDEVKEEKTESLEEMFEYMDDEYKKFSLKVKKFEDVEKLGKDLYKVDAKIEMKAETEDGDENKSTKTFSFIVYKDKLIYSEM